MKKFFANIALMCVVTLVCIVIAEVGLRALTPFPIHGRKANKIYDMDAGYRLNPGHPSVDRHGFRNTGEKPPVFAALGDSHTFGTNVKPEQSWPEQFEKMTGVPTYNFGVGSYAVYAHFANAHRALERGYKYIIIALLIHNDFKVNGNSCDIDYASSQFWQDAKKRLDLSLPDCSGADNWRTAKAPGFIRWFRGRGSSAILSATDYLVMRPLSDWWYRVTYVAPAAPKARPAKPQPGAVKPEKKPAAASGKYPASHYFAGRALRNQEVEFAFTDLNRSEVTTGIADFEKMLADLKRAVDEKGSKIGLMFIPTKVQLFHEYLDDLDIYRKIPVLEAMARNQQQIEKRLMDFMDGIGFTWSTAKPQLIEAIEAEDRTGKRVFNPTAGHPNPAGYKAYARAAIELFKRLKED